MTYNARLRKLSEVINNPWFKWNEPARNSWGTKVLKLEIAYKDGMTDEIALAELEKNNPGDGFIYAAGPLY